MPRGRETEAEQTRIRSGEKLNVRDDAKTGTGAAAYEKAGYGGGKMQVNPKSPKESL